MTDAWIAALIAALGVTVASLISVFGGRGRLHRMEVVARILNDLPADSSARESLVEVLREDSDELLRARRSPVTFLISLGVVALIISLVLGTSGNHILNWSPPIYLSLAMAMVISSVLFVAFGVALAILLFVRWVRGLIAKKRSKTRPVKSPVADATDVRPEAGDTVPLGE